MPPVNSSLSIRIARAGRYLSLPCRLLSARASLTAKAQIRALVAESWFSTVILGQVSFEKGSQTSRSSRLFSV